MAWLLLDGGFDAFAADAGSFESTEGHGVDPDIVVENEASAVIDGKDPQLERGIAEVLKAMDAAPKKLPGRPALVLAVAAFGERRAQVLLVERSARVVFGGVSV